jgi:hypothetical protein
MTELRREHDESAVLRELRSLGARVDALQADVRGLARPQLPEEREPEVGAEPSYAWLGSLGPAPPRRPTVPRLLLEAAFLVAVAALAAAADLEPLVIGAVMAGAWVLVALAEWAAARADRSHDALLAAPPVAPAGPAPADPSWFSPPVEQTLVGARGSEPDTAITRLPSPTADDTGEQR